MVRYVRRLVARRGQKRRRNGTTIHRRSVRPPGTLRMRRRRWRTRPRVMSSMAARPFFDASRWYHLPDSGAPINSVSIPRLKALTVKPSQGVLALVAPCTFLKIYLDTFTVSLLSFNSRA